MLCCPMLPAAEKWLRQSGAGLVPCVHAYSVLDLSKVQGYDESSPAQEMVVSQRSMYCEPA